MYFIGTKMFFFVLPQITNLNQFPLKLAPERQQLQLRLNHSHCSSRSSEPNKHKIYNSN